jgi:hypothetical protein
MQFVSADSPLLPCSTTLEIVEDAFCYSLHPLLTPLCGHICLQRHAREAFCGTFFCIDSTLLTPCIDCMSLCVCRCSTTLEIVEDAFCCFDASADGYLEKEEVQNALCNTNTPGRCARSAIQSCYCV